MVKILDCHSRRYRFESCLFHTEKKILKRIIMGRIARKGFEYYRAETDRFRDIKIRKLRKEHSCAGYAIYQYVLNEIYRVEGCYIRFTQDELFDCAEYWNMRDCAHKGI